MKNHTRRGLIGLMIVLGATKAVAQPLDETPVEAPPEDRKSPPDEAGPSIFGTEAPGSENEPPLSLQPTRPRAAIVLNLPTRAGTARERSPRGDTAAHTPEGGAPLPAYAHRDEHFETAPDAARGWDEEPGTEPEDVVLFGPRAILFVPNAVLKLVFLPIRGLAVVMYRYRVLDHLKEFFYNDAGTAAILPSLSFTTAHGFSYGARAFHSDMAGHGEHGSISAKFGGIYSQGYQIAFRGDSVGGSRLWLDTVVRYEVKPALSFYGFGDGPENVLGPDLGPRDGAVATRFSQERFLAAGSLGTTIGERGALTKVGLATTYNHRVFGARERGGGEPSIETVYDVRQIPGFDRSVNSLETGPRVVHDTRKTKAVTPSGVYLDMFGGHTLPVEEETEFWHYGVEAAFFVDLYRGSRVLAFRGLLEAVAGDAEDIPFSDLPRLGGSRRLRGYRQDRFRDRIVALSTAEYHYPVHHMVAGNLFVDAGRVGRDYDDVFGRDAFKQWRVGGGIGAIIHSETANILRIEAAYGEQFMFFLTTEPLGAFGNRNRRL